MKRIVYILLIIIGIVSIFIFIRISNDETEVDLGHRYYYIPFQEVTFDVTMFKGNGIFKYKNEGCIPVIFPNIKSYKYDSLYIIVKQQFNYFDTKTLIGSMLFRPVYFKYDKDYVLLDLENELNTPDMMNSTEEDEYVDGVMKKDHFINQMIKNKDNYYIIDKVKNQTMGPFDINTFNRRKIEMKINLSF